jgi:hypothetical protein
MRIRAPRDFWSGLLFIAVAAGFMLLSRQYSLGNMHRMGPGLFPSLVGGLLALLGIAITLRSLAFDGPPVPAFQARPIIVSLAAIVLFGVTLQWSGLVAAVAALVLLGALASRESRVWETVMLALVLIAFSTVVFVWLLGLPIPLWSDS